MDDDIELLYRQHLTETDRRLLSAGSWATLEMALASTEIEYQIFHEGTPGGRSSARYPGFVGISPFLIFAVAVHRTGIRLGEVHFVEERFSRRQRIPVFDLESLRSLIEAPMRRYFLTTLLASYTHVMSGTTWERTARGWRRHRFSELDPVRLAGLLEIVEATARPGIYRRLGDLALFLTGVFPDSRSLDIGSVAMDRLSRSSELATPIDSHDGRALFESLGARWYRQAVKTACAIGMPTTAELAVVAEMSQRFIAARRILNIVTEWYLFPFREQWFGVEA